MSWQLNLRQMEAFRAVMLAGTTTRAAEALNISQPAVSRLVHELEGQLGVQLFVRRQGGLQPTPEAEWLFHEAEETMSHLDRLDRSMRGIRHLKARRPLRLVTTSPMAYGLLPQALLRFRGLHPEISVSVQITVRRELRNWIDAQQFDVAVTTLPVDYPEGDREDLARVRAVCVLPAGHPLTDRDVVHASDLVDEPFVSLLPETLARLRVDRVFEQVGRYRHMAIETQTSPSVCVFVASGLGVAITDPFTAAAFEALGIVARPFLPAFEFDYGVLFPVRRPRSHVAGVFVQILRETAAALTSAYRRLSPDA